MTVQRIGILTSGGDAPGMNAAIRAATLVARAQGAVGIERGDRGLLDGAFRPLAPADVAIADTRSRTTGRSSSR
jgi:6-phosphofructokinase 1